MKGNIFMNTQGLYQRRRAFNMSYRNDLTCNLGEVIPVYWQDLIPNTTWHCRVHGLVRFMPLIAPILSNIDLYVHFWQSPDRILYGDEFTKVITGELESDEWPGVYFVPSSIYGDLASKYGEELPEVIPYLTGDGSLLDLLGYDKSLFVGSDSSDGKLNARKFIMYIRLMRDWYSNENIEPWSGFLEYFDWQNILDIANEQNGNISEVISDFIISCFETWNTAGYMSHQWPKDYFTSALPTLQYGLPTYLPLGTDAPVSIPVQPARLGAPFDELTNNPLRLDYFSPDYVRPESGLTVEADTGRMGRAAISARGDSDYYFTAAQGLLQSSTGEQLQATADLTEATAITINELRIANALQVFKEREMRYGRKPQEYYRGFYGVTPGDLRLQMPKFLGGGKMPVNISDIEQTSQTTEDSPQGNLSGKGTGIAGGFARASTFAPEETLVMGVAWLMPHVLYSQSLSRHDTKLNDRFDYYNPSFAHIGEQPVYNYEVYGGAYGTEIGNKEFGYQPRYTEYRFHASEIHGDFKSSLSFWTLGRIFDSRPALNANFIYMQPKTLNRIFAVRETVDGFPVRNVLLSLQFQAAVIQPLSRYGTPGLMP